VHGVASSPSLAHNLVAQSFDCTWGSNLAPKAVQFDEKARVLQAFWVLYGETQDTECRASMTAVNSLVLMGSS